MLLRTDDAVARLRAVWLGPEEMRLPVDWTFVEWGLFLAVAIVLTVLAAFTVAPILFQPFTGPVLDLLPSTMLAFGTAFMIRSRVAPMIDSDRRARYLAGNAVRAAGMLMWAHGPVDRAVLVAAGSPALVVLVVAGWIPAVLAFVACVGVARWIRDRVESPERYWLRIEARSARRVGVDAINVGMPVKLEVAA